MNKNVLFTQLLTLLTLLLVSGFSSAKPMVHKATPLTILEDAIEARSITATYDHLNKTGIVKVMIPDCNEAECNELFFKINENTQYYNGKNAASVDELVARPSRPATVFYNRSNPDFLSRIRW